MFPAYFANMSPVLGKGILNKLAVPVDFGKTFRGKPIFGKNKTWRGLFLGAVVGVIVVYLQKLIGIGSLVNYNDLGINTVLLIGLLLGLGAVIGDLVESFFKRQFGIKSGKPWVPFDQIDFIVGSVVLVLFVSEVRASLGLLEIFSIFFFTPFLHALFSFLGFVLRLKKDKW